MKNIHICPSTINVTDFNKQLCAIQEQIFYLYKEKRQPPLLAIDEAQYLSTGILNDIKMLINYDYDSVNCLSLLLCGKSHLYDTLRRTSFYQVKSPSDR